MTKQWAFLKTLVKEAAFNSGISLSERDYETMSRMDDLVSRLNRGTLIAEGKSPVLSSLVELASTLYNNNSSILPITNFVRESEEPDHIFFTYSSDGITICSENEADYGVYIDLEDGYLVHRLYKKEV